MSLGFRCSLVIVLLLGSQLGCENLGLDPSGKLACSSPPQNLCPKGFFCNAGRCWRNGTVDGLVDCSREKITRSPVMPKRHE